MEVRVYEASDMDKLLLVASELLGPGLPFLPHLPTPEALISPQFRRLQSEALYSGMNTKR